MTFAVELLQHPEGQDAKVTVFEMSTDTLQRALIGYPQNVLAVNHHRLTPAQKDMLARIGHNRGVVAVASGERKADMHVTARMGGRMQTMSVDPEGGVTFATNLPDEGSPTWRRL